MNYLNPKEDKVTLIPLTKHLDFKSQILVAGSKDPKNLFLIIDYDNYKDLTHPVVNLVRCHKTTFYSNASNLDHLIGSMVITISLIKRVICRGSNHLVHIDYMNIKINLRVDLKR